jgi:hypothetical protein
MIRNLGGDDWEALPRIRVTGFSKDHGSIERLGGKLGIWCDIDWSNEEYNNYGIIAWRTSRPSRAFQRYGQDRRRYIHARTILGTKT